MLALLEVTSVNPCSLQQEYTTSEVAFYRDLKIWYLTTSY